MALAGTLEWSDAARGWIADRDTPGEPTIGRSTASASTTRFATPSAARRKSSPEMALK
ncbi:hypothetical protein AOX55_00002535 [Sinorhizobium fredii CCBAU 25509]|nr:hypothetical protein AOX55_00002535 [Sinorhizobium fredii CCBAU 25509]